MQAGTFLYSGTLQAPNDIEDEFFTHVCVIRKKLKLTKK
jgi:hypothetical protein